MNITVPQIVSGIISFFIVSIGMRVFIPIIEPIMGLTWQNTTVYWALRIVIYLIAFMLVYVIAYGTMTNKKPAMLGDK